MSVRQPPREELERWADDEYLVGHLLSTMLHGHLDLEEAVAMGSIAQDELSHASLICDLLGENGRQKDERFLLREAHQFSCSTLAAHEMSSWAEAVAKHLLYEEAERDRIASADIETVMRREEEHHRGHWWAWTRALCAGESGRAGFQAAVDRLWPLTADLFDMSMAGVGNRQAWLDRLEAGLRPLGIGLTALPPERSRADRPAAVAEGLERVISISQSVFRLDPQAVWA